MAETLYVTSFFDTAARLVEVLEREGYALRAAIIAPWGEDRWRLVLAPANFNRGRGEMIKVATIISRHHDELPGIDDLHYQVAEPGEPLVRALARFPTRPGDPLREVRGLFDGPNYIENAVVLRMAA